ADVELVEEAVVPEATSVVAAASPPPPSSPHAETTARQSTPPRIPRTSRCHLLPMSPPRPGAVAAPSTRDATPLRSDPTAPPFTSAARRLACRPMADPRPRLGAAGIGVRDLERSVDFYTRIFGMKVLMKLPLPDMDEVIVGFEGASTAVVLMQHHDPSGHDYASTGGKLAFYVPDPVAVAE